MTKKRSNKSKSKDKHTKNPFETLDQLKQDIGDDEYAAMNKTAKTHKGRKILQLKEEGKELEDPKFSVIMKGPKCSALVTTALRELHKLRSPVESLNLSNKNNKIHPFEDATGIENKCEKHQAGLFCFGHSQKKRPHNVIFGRVFDKKILDMFEFAVSDLVEMKQNVRFQSGLKPLIIFQGD